jgi:hypothetical protein
MSTRSLTRVRDTSGDVIVCMYRHCDGYPSGHGLELAQWLSGKTVGSGAQKDPNYFNGMEHLAARLVAYFSDLHPHSNIYLQVPAEDDSEEYNYEISLGIGGRLRMKANGTGCSFDGLPENFAAYLAEQEASEG